MATLSVRTIASECLRKSGSLSLKGDIVGLRNSSLPQSLRSELEFIHEFRCSPNEPNEPSDPSREFPISLRRQIVNSGRPPYTGQFPVAGVGSGRLLKIRLLSDGTFGVSYTLYFQKNDGSGEDVPINEGATSTPEQMREIFGVAEPRYGPNQTITFLAFIDLALGLSFPDKVDIELTLIDD